MLPLPRGAGVEITYRQDQQASIQGTAGVAFGCHTCAYGGRLQIYIQIVFGILRRRSIEWETLGLRAHVWM